MSDIVLNGGSDFFDKVFEENLKERKIIINTDIGEDIIEAAVMQILKFNKEDKGLPIEVRKPIKIFLNSVGGEVANGFALIDAILLSKTPIWCIVVGYAYSMGGLILLAGHKKLAFKNATILIHDGNCGASSSGSKFKDIAKFYDKMDARIKDYVLSRTTMTSDFYDEKYEKEFYLYADEEGKKLGIVDFIIGEDIDLDEIL